MSEKYSKFLSVITIVFVGAVVAQTVFSAATVVPPPCGPTSPGWPNCNSEPPITVGPAPQTKIGDLGTAGNLIVGSSLGVGILNPKNKLEVLGDASVLSGGLYVEGGDGDANGNGLIDVGDMAIAEDCAAGAVSSSCARVDINGDNKINSLDFDYLQFTGSLSGLQGAVLRQARMQQRIFSASAVTPRGNGDLELLPNSSTGTVRIKPNSNDGQVTIGEGGFINLDLRGNLSVIPRPSNDYQYTRGGITVSTSTIAHNVWPVISMWPGYLRNNRMTTCDGRVSLSDCPNIVPDPANSPSSPSPLYDLIIQASPPSQPAGSPVIDCKVPPSGDSRCTFYAAGITFTRTAILGEPDGGQVWAYGGYFQKNLLVGAKLNASSVEILHNVELATAPVGIVKIGSGYVPGSTSPSGDQPPFERPKTLIYSDNNTAIGLKVRQDTALHNGSPWGGIGIDVQARATSGLNNVAINARAAGNPNSNFAFVGQGDLSITGNTYIRGNTILFSSPIPVPSTTTYRLDVRGRVNADEICINDDCRNSWPEGGSTTGPSTPGSGSPGGRGVTNHLAFWSNANTLDSSIITENGTGVGISSNPTSNLGLTIQAPPGATGWLQFKDNTGGNRWHLTGFGGGFSLVETGVSGGDGRFFIRAGDGNVGLGTINPQKKLDVVGGVRANEFCLGADCISAWPVGGVGGGATEQNLNDNGYTQFGSMIIQWGHTGNGGISENPRTVTYPKPMSRVFNAQCTVGANGNGGATSKDTWCQVLNPGTTSATFFMQSAAPNQRYEDMYWMVIGQM